MTPKTFGHSGDLGDALYSLPSIKALGGGELVLYRDEGVREKFDLTRAYNLGNLVGRLPYITNWSYYDHPVKCDYQFADFRRNYNNENLAVAQAKAVGAAAILNEPWIDVPGFEIVGNGVKRDVVFCRSHRYHDPEFPWKDIAEKYRDRAVFVGVRSEWDAFIHDIAYIPHVPTATLYEVAMVLKGADLIVSNQTASYAIAEAMKCRVALERWEKCPNVDFFREGIYVGEKVKELL